MDHFTTEAFEELKENDQGPCPVYPQPDLPFEVTTDALDFAVGAVLSQDQGQGLQPVVFTSHKMNPAKRNYTTHEKETWHHAHITKWCVYLEVTIVVHLTHATLQHFPDQPKLSRHQAPLDGKDEEYDFVIKYLPGKQNVVADAVSCRPDLMLNSVFQW